MVSLAGMEMSSVHVTNMKNPTSAFPRAIFLASLIILFFSIFGALSVALVVPGTQLSMSAGVCQSFETMLKALGFHGSLLSLLLFWPTVLSLPS